MSIREQPAENVMSAANVFRLCSTPAAVKVLAAFFQARAGLSSKELAEATGLGRTTVVVLLGKFYKAGLVTPPESNLKPARFLTDAGIEVASAARRLVYQTDGPLVAPERHSWGWSGPKMSD